MSAYDSKSASISPAGGLVSSAQAAAAFTTESNNPTATSSNKLLQYQLMRDIIANSEDAVTGVGFGDSKEKKAKVAAIDKLMFNNLKYELATIGLIDKNPQFRRIMGDDPSKIEQFSNLLRSKAIEKEIDEMVNGTVAKLIDKDASAATLTVAGSFL